MPIIFLIQYFTSDNRTWIKRSITLKKEIVKLEFWKHYSEWGKERMGGENSLVSQFVVVFGLRRMGEKERKFAYSPFAHSQSIAIFKMCGILYL